MFRLLAIAFLIAVGLSSLAALEPQSNTNKPAQKAKAAKQGTENNPLFVKVVPADKSEPKPSKKQQTEQHGSENEVRIATATVALAWITGTLAFFTALLWLANLALVKDSKKSAQAARDSADAMRDANSPYLFPELKGFKIRNNRPTAMYVFRNYGNTPAVLNRFQDEPKFTQRLPAEPERTELLMERPERETVIAPNGVGPEPPITFGFPVGLSLDDFRARYAQDRMRLYMIGRVGFEDLFGRSHIKDFCMEIVPRDHETLPIWFRVAGGKTYNGWHKDV